LNGVKATCGNQDILPQNRDIQHGCRASGRSLLQLENEGADRTILLSSGPGVSIIQGITESAPTPAGMETRIGGRIDTLDVRYEPMTWTKPEFEIVAVTLEVTAYAATR